MCEFSGNGLRQIPSLFCKLYRLRFVELSARRRGRFSFHIGPWNRQGGLGFHLAQRDGRDRRSNRRLRRNYSGIPSHPKSRLQAVFYISGSILVLLQQLVRDLEVVPFRQCDQVSDSLRIKSNSLRKRIHPRKLFLLSVVVDLLTSASLLA